MLKYGSMLRAPSAPVSASCPFSQRSARQQTADDHPGSEGDEQAGDGSLFHLAADRLYRTLALIRQVLVNVRCALVELIEQVLRRLAGAIDGTILHLIHQPAQIALQRSQIVNDGVEIGGGLGAAACFCCSHGVISTSLAC